MEERNIKFNTRKEWLEAAVEFFRARFIEAGKPLPEKVKVAIGFPHKGGTAKRRTLGQCWKPEAAADAIAQIYINPTIDSVDAPYGILATLVHELVHAAGIFNHGKEFGQIARRVGLEGRKMTSTYASDGLIEDFQAIIAELGDIPHCALVPASVGTGKKDGTRLLKCECSDPECGYNFRITKKWAEMGIPECPVCGNQMKMNTPIEE